MSCYPRNLDRAAYIQKVAKEINSKAAYRVLCETVQTYGSEAEVDAALSLLEEALNAGGSWTKPQVCDPKDCEDCFFKLLCMQWGNARDDQICRAWDTLEEAQEKKRQQEREKKLHTPQTFNAEWLAKVDEEKHRAYQQHVSSLNLIREAELVFAETKESLHGTLTPERQVAYKKAHDALKRRMLEHG